MGILQLSLFLALRLAFIVFVASLRIALLAYISALPRAASARERERKGVSYLSAGFQRGEPLLLEL
jgi:hypothetical protein